jgi:plastocyanin
MAIKKNTIWMSMIFIVLVVAGLFLNSGSGLGNGLNGAVVNNAIGALSGNVQVVKMHVEGSRYIFEPSSVKKGVPVRLEADISRMPGCSKSVISSELGIRKTFNSGDNTFEFTPSKAGSFYVACSMNMYKGTLTVLESDGSKPSYVQAPSSSGASCSAGGGCGCGG